MRTHGSQTRWCCLAISLFACPAAGAGAAGPTFGLAANERVMWLWQMHGPREAGQPALITLAFRARTSSAQPFQRTYYQVAGDIHCTAVLAEQLYAVFGDGAHALYSPTGRTSGWVIQPNRAVPSAICADPADETLYAVVPAVVAIELISAETQPATQPSPPSTADHEASKREPPGEPELAVDMQAAMPRTNSALIGIDSGRWRFDRDLPPSLDPGEHCWIAAHRGAVTCVFFDQQTSELTWAHAPRLNWSIPQPLPGVQRQQVVALTSAPGDGEAVLVVLDTSKGEPTLCPWRLSDDRWAPGGVLQAAQISPEATSVEFSAARSGERLVVARLVGTAVIVGEWPLDGGAPLTNPAPVDALSPLSPPVIGQTPQTIVAYVVLFAVVGWTLAARRGALTSPAPLAPGQIPAPLSRRAAAFFVDALVVSPLIYVALRPWEAELLLLVAAQQSGDATPPAGIDRLRPMTIGTAVFAAYSLVFEAALGATPGKRILLCRVVDEQGQPARLGAIIVRNLLRMIEFYPAYQFVPVFLLILLTPSRQRLGDLMARTVVVQRVPVPQQE